VNVARKRARPSMKTYLRWFFEDQNTGKIVIAQFPNVWLVAFLLAWAVEAVTHPNGTIGFVIIIAKAASLTIWAIDEILRGVNPWRRCLGTAAVLFELITWLKP
jgi:hypothetical protein